MDRRKLHKIILEELGASGRRPHARLRKLGLKDYLDESSDRHLLSIDDDVIISIGRRFSEGLGDDSDDITTAGGAFDDAAGAEAPDDTPSPAPVATPSPAPEPTPVATPESLPVASTDTSPPDPGSDPLVGALLAGAEAEETARRGTTSPAPTRPSTATAPAPVDAGGATDPDIPPADSTADPVDISGGDPDIVDVGDVDPGPDVSSDDSDGVETTTSTSSTSEEPTDDEVASVIDYIDSVAVDEVPAGAADLAESRKSRKRLSLAFLLYDAQ